MSFWSLCCPVAPPPLAMMRDERVDTLQSRVDQLSREQERTSVLVEQMQRGTEKLERRLDDLMLQGTPSVRTSAVSRAAAVGAPVVVDPLAEIRADRHKYDAEIMLPSGGIWGIARAHDWLITENDPRSARKAALFTKVGVGEYGNHDEADPGAKFLLIQHVHTAIKVGNGRGPDPAAWGLAFTATEFNAAAAEALKSGTTLIKRTPTTGDTAKGRTDVFNESHWLIEGGSVVGVRSVAKASQFDQPSTTDVRFRVTPSGGFELEEKVEDEGGAADKTIAGVAEKVAKSKGAEWQKKLLAGGGKLTKTAVDAPLPGVLFEAPPATAFESTVEGDMPLQLSLAKEHTLPFYAYTEPLEGDTVGFRQSVYSGKILMSNPTESVVSVTGTTSEFLAPDGTWTPFDNGGDVTTTEGGPLDRWSTGMQVQFRASPHQQGELIVCSKHRIKGSRSYTDDGALNRRLHHSFGTSMTVRLTFTDDQGRTKTLTYRADQSPLDGQCQPMPKSLAEGLREKHRIKGDGLKDAECPIWLALNDPVTLESLLVCVTFGEAQYYVRCTTVLSNELLNYKSYGAYALKKIAYDAVQNGESEVEVDSVKSRTKDEKEVLKCVVVAVIDTDAKEVIGFKAKVQATDPETGAVVASAAQSMLIDWTALANPPEAKKADANDLFGGFTW